MLRTPSLLAAPFLLSSLLLAAPAAAQPAEVEPPSPARFRGGVGLAAALSAPGPLLAAGLQARLGAQIDDRFAVFLQPEVFLGFNIRDGHGGLLAGALSPMFELTLADHVSFGVGPTILFGVYSPTSGDPGSGAIPGGILRLAAGFGSKAPGRRHQFTIALEPRLLYTRATGPSGLFSLSLGYDAK